LYKRSYNSRYNTKHLGSIFRALSEAVLYTWIQKAGKTPPMNSGSVEKNTTIERSSIRVPVELQHSYEESTTSTTRTVLVALNQRDWTWI